MRVRTLGIVIAMLLAMSVTADADEPPSRPVPAPQCVGAPPWFPPVTSTVYLPNITRTLGGSTGFYTPFIIQNTGAAETQLVVRFYRFSDGTCVQQYIFSNLAPGRAHSNDPNDSGRNPSLPNDSQFSVVVESFGSTIVGVVNEHQGIGDRAEALSYDGFNRGAKTVYLPNITRRFFGLFDTPFIIQNLGTGIASVTSTFRPFDGVGPTVVIPRTIDVGRAKPIDPDSDDPSFGAPGLTDNKQYAVTVTSNQDIAVVVNTQNDKPSVEHPVAWATNGITTGAETVYGAYAAKTNGGTGTFYSPIIVQNVGSAAVTPKITFTPYAAFETAGANTYMFPTIQPGASKAFDPRFTLSSQGTTNTLCGAAGSSDCLSDGEYTFRIDAPGGSIAAQVNVSSVGTGEGYSATAVPSAKLYAPNVTKGLCFCPVPNFTAGWTGSILIQSVTAASVTLRWYSTASGALAHTDTFSIQPGRGVRRSPWSYDQLAPDKEYSVVMESGGGMLTAIVWAAMNPGDQMIYEAFAAP